MSGTHSFHSQQLCGNNDTASGPSSPDVSHTPLPHLRLPPLALMAPPSRVTCLAATRILPPPSPPPSTFAPMVPPRLPVFQGSDRVDQAYASPPHVSVSSGAAEGSLPRGVKAAAKGCAWRALEMPGDLETWRPGLLVKGFGDMESACLAAMTDFTGNQLSASYGWSDEECGPSRRSL